MVIKGHNNTNIQNEQQIKSTIPTESYFYDELSGPVVTCQVLNVTENLPVDFILGYDML